MGRGEGGSTGRGNDSKESTCLYSIPVLGSSSLGGHGKPLQYSCLENPYGQRNLTGYSPCGCKDLNTTERLSTSTHTEAKVSPIFITLSP